MRLQHLRVPFVSQTNLIHDSSNLHKLRALVNAGRHAAFSIYLDRVRIELVSTQDFEEYGGEGTEHYVCMQEVKSLFESSHLIVALGILIQVQHMTSQRRALLQLYKHIGNQLTHLSWVQAQSKTANVTALLLCFLYLMLWKEDR